MSHSWTIPEMPTRWRKDLTRNVKQIIENPELPLPALYTRCSSPTSINMTSHSAVVVLYDVKPLVIGDCSAEKSQLAQITAHFQSGDGIVFDSWVGRGRNGSKGERKRQGDPVYYGMSRESHFHRIVIQTSIGYYILIWKVAEGSGLDSDYIQSFLEAQRTSILEDSHRPDGLAPSAFQAAHELQSFLSSNQLDCNLHLANILAALPAVEEEIEGSVDHLNALVLQTAVELFDAPTGQPEDLSAIQHLPAFHSALYRYVYAILADHPSSSHSYDDSHPPSAPEDDESDVSSSVSLSEQVFSPSSGCDTSSPPSTPGTVFEPELDIDFGVLASIDMDNLSSDPLSSIHMMPSDTFNVEQLDLDWFNAQWQPLMQ